MTTASAAPLAPMTFREVLGLTVMRRVWYAQVVSLLGDFLALFAVISVVTYQMDGTPQQVTGVQIAYMLPLAVLGPLSGVFVDRRCDPRDLVAANCDVAGEPRRSRAVHDAPVLQEEIVGRGLRLERGERREEPEGRK